MKAEPCLAISTVDQSRLSIFFANCEDTVQILGWSAPDGPVSMAITFEDRDAYSSGNEILLDACRPSLRRLLEAYLKAAHLWQDKKLSDGILLLMRPEGWFGGSPDKGGRAWNGPMPLPSYNWRTGRLIPSTPVPE